MGRYRFLLAFSFIAFSAYGADLKILTYDGLAADWGVGPKWEAGFEKKCGCDIVFNTVNGGSSAIISRAMFDKGGYDILLGIDNSMMADALRLDLVQPHQITLPKLKIDWNDKEFIPFDYSWLAFVGRKADNLPKSMEDLINREDIRVVLEDPKTSGFAHWLYGVYGNGAKEAWAKLSTHIVTITPSWSEAYKLFLEGEADMVMSYTTSPVYHMANEKDDSYAAPAFSEGNYMQIELGVITKNSQNPELAKQFLSYLVSEEAQNAIPLTNIMFPVLPVDLPDAFDHLDIPKKTIYPLQSNQRINDLWMHDIAQ